MKRITQDSEVEEVMKQIGVGEGEELRESEKRRQTLEKFAQLRSRNPNTTLTLDNTETAFVAVDEGLEEFVDITVTTRKFPQKKTDLPEDYHDYLIQRAMTVHECGHVLYSSYPALMKYTQKVKNEEDENEKVYGEMFQHFVNVAEDGAIEKFLSDDFNVGEELTVMRASLHEDTYMGQAFTVGEEEEYHYPFFFAIMTAMLNIGVYDNGELRKLLDPDNDKHQFGKAGMQMEREMFQNQCIPKIESYIKDIQSESNAEERVRLCYELWDYVRDYMERAATPGRMEFQSEMSNSGGSSYSEGVPENLSEGHGDQDSEPIMVGSGDEEAGDSEDNDSQGFGESRKEEVEEMGDSDEGESAGDKAERGIKEEVQQQGDADWSDEIEKIISSLGASDGTDEITIAEGENVNQNRKNRAERFSQRTARLFRRRLRQLQKDKEKRGQRRGRIDTRQMISADRGSTRIFKRTEEGDDKDYSCMIVADRSGSMGSRIDEVDFAIHSISKGLEENGVDVSVLDTYSSKTTLSKPFGASVDGFEDNILAGRCAGGTPLRHTVEFARERIGQGAGDFPFMVVITDGRPSNTSAYMEELRKASFPVLGLYIANSRESVSDQLELFDKAVVSTADDDLQSQMINLIKSVAF